jgi:adenine-specific DNA-methyltransferase
MTVSQPAAIVEDPHYLGRQLLTYIGNKRSLLGFIGDAVQRVKRRLGKPKLSMLDAFSGSGVVSRFFKAHASLLVSNDLEDYAAVTARCFLRNRSEADFKELARLVTEINRRVDTEAMDTGFIEQLYAPRDESRITREDRVFYTRENARRLDHYRQLLGAVPQPTHDLLLGPLLSKASVHANTAGVFKGFYKDRATGIGRFGGSGADALGRIRGKIVLEPPVLSRFQCDVAVRQQDANQLARELGHVDLAYIDPPYNQHPYGSNYFMLNLLVRYQRPGEISTVSGIPKDWRRSGYNVRGQSAALLEDLLTQLDASFVLISFNDEGFITPQQMQAMHRRPPARLRPRPRRRSAQRRTAAERRSSPCSRRSR